MQFFIGHAGEVRKIKAQMVGCDQRSCLLHVLAQNFAQAGLKQVRGRVVAHGGLADVGVNYGIDFVAYANRLFRDDLVRPHALNRRVAAFHFGDDGVVIVGVEPSAVADLSAGFSVERGVIEDDFPFVSGLELLRALAVVDDRENLAAVRASLAVAFEFRFRKLLVGWVRRLLGCAFPGGASALALLGHGDLKSAYVKHNCLIAAGLLDEVQRQAISVIQLESITALIDRRPIQVDRL